MSDCKVQERFQVLFHASVCLILTTNLCPSFSLSPGSRGNKPGTRFKHLLCHWKVQSQGSEPEGEGREGRKDKLQGQSHVLATVVAGLHGLSLLECTGKLPGVVQQREGWRGSVSSSPSHPLSQVKVLSRVIPFWSGRRSHRAWCLAL